MLINEKKHQGFQIEVKFLAHHFTWAALSIYKENTLLALTGSLELEMYLTSGGDAAVNPASHADVDDLRRP